MEPFLDFKADSQLYVLPLATIEISSTIKGIFDKPPVGYTSHFKQKT